jgi:hypothetical protein
MDSDPASAGTTVRTRAQAAAASAAGGPGVAEQFTFTSPVAESAGLVVVNAAGAGPYTLYVDTTAPSGILLIDGGAPSTDQPLVTLSHDLTDAQTGIESMRISQDGVFDTEPWVPYAPTSMLILANISGTRTVYAQYRNNAGLVSATHIDKIQFVPAPE